MPRFLLAMLAAASALVPARRLPVMAKPRARPSAVAAPQMGYALAAPAKFALKWALPSIATVVAGRWLKKRLDRPSRPYDLSLIHI